MLRSLRRILKSKSGATAIEYGLIAALIAVVIISALIIVGNNLTDIFQQVSSQLAGAAN